jgi:hypothetical protein
MAANISDYLRTVENYYAQGIATESTYRPTLKTLVEGLGDEINAVNEPQHVACGAPDFLICRKTGYGMETLGYIETKDIGKPLSQEERSEQMKRYLAGLRNLILTDYLDFRWYVDGSLRRSARLAETGPGPKGGKLKKIKDGATAVEELLKDFLNHQPEQISSAAELAQRMARLTHLIRDIVMQAFQLEQASSLLKDWRGAFAKVLIADLDQPEKVGEFADMFAQTLAYGLFSARMMDESKGFTLQEAQRLIPKSNPFLRKFFFEITGPDLEDEPFAGYVNDLVQLLDHSDMVSILIDFEKRSGHDDPVVHFYETFLAAYDPRLRELRGVYYTPKPVVSFIVRSIDHLLKTRFNLPEGLADASKISLPNPDKSSKNKKVETHKVLVLDPATGTATFPYTVIELIRQEFMQRGDAGMWSSYVHEALLPRLYAFELLMAPYAVAHFKLALQLAAIDLPQGAQRATWAYNFAAGERLNVFLTNTLEEPHEWTGLPLFTQFLADETQQANRVKQDLPIMVILGNPPYSGQSSNQGKWIRDLVQDYYFLDGKPLGEKNPKWLQDDYVKFIRWAQWRIECTGSGVLGFITNNGYLDNPTFRGMRQSLMKTFDEIFILNLHGNAKKKEIAPDGSVDKNVFDIQQGVSIGIFLRRTNHKSDGAAKAGSIYHAEFWGSRESKYSRLQESDIETITWEKLEPVSPYYLFVPQNSAFREEYARGWKINEIFPVNSVGVVTARDALTISWTPEQVWETVMDFLALPVETAREKYQLGKDAQDWKVELAQDDLKNSGPTQDNIVPIQYRPFDIRYTYYTGRSRGFICRPRAGVMGQMRMENMGFHLCRQTSIDSWQHVLATNQITDDCYVSNLTSERGYTFPIYTYPIEKQSALFSLQNRIPNFERNFLEELSGKIGCAFVPKNSGDLKNTLDSEDIFHYIYAILHSPTYRERYAEFLKMDFPRIPLTSNRELFCKLCTLGGELVSLHLLEAPQLGQLMTRYPVPGDNRVERGYPRYTAESQRVYISPKQYFEGVPPQVWEFHIGGYQVLDKWLKDRRGRLLTFDDLTHYQKVVVALSETMRVMEEIAAAIPGWPVE